MNEGLEEFIYQEGMYCEDIDDRYTKLVYPKKEKSK